MANTVVQLPQRRQIDYGQLGQLAGQAVNPMAGMYAQILPLLFKSQLEQQRSKALLDELRSGGNGPFGDYEINFGPGGTITGYKQKSPQQKLEDIANQRKLDVMRGVPQIPPSIPSGESTAPQPRIPQVVTDIQPTQQSDKIPTEFDELGFATKFVSREGIAAKKRAEKMAEFDIKKEQLRKDLKSFFAIDDIIQENRAEGGFLETRKAGFDLIRRSMAQAKGDTVGQAANAYRGMVKRVRVQLVRAAGDVGNINIVEQKAAEQIISTFFDSKRTAQLKRAFMLELAEAVDTNDGDRVKQTLESFMQTQAYKPPEFNTEEEAIKADLPDNTVVIIGGKRYVWESEE